MDRRPDPPRSRMAGGIPGHRARQRHRVRRGAQRTQHDPQRPRHQRGPGQQRQGQDRPGPKPTGDRACRADDDPAAIRRARRNAHRAGARSRHQSDMQRLQLPPREEPREPSALPVHELWTYRQRRRQRCPQRTGPRRHHHQGADGRVLDGWTPAVRRSQRKPEERRAGAVSPARNAALARKGTRPRGARGFSTPTKRPATQESCPKGEAQESWPNGQIS